MGHAQPIELGAEDVVVLGVDEDSGFALVLGRAAHVSELGETVDTVPERYLKRVVANAGLVGRFAGSFDTDHGRWVRLTRESALKMKELTASGAPKPSMGVLRGVDGRFAHVTRFDVVSPVPFDPATFAASLAIQQVVKQIEVKLDEIAKDVQGLISGAKNEIEAQLASAADVIVRIERRVRDRGLVDDDDWASLANLEPIVKQSYHQTFLWLEPLRAFLDDGKISMVEQVKALRGEHGLKDADFWLRMHLHSELALKRWELLYLIRESTVAPERLADEAAEVRQGAERRHEVLLEMVELLSAYLDADDQDPEWRERLRFLSRHRLAALRYELAQVANAYAEGLRRAQLTVPAYIQVTEPGPLIDVDGLQRLLKDQALPALGSGARTAADTLARAGKTGWRSASQLGARLRRDPASTDDEPEQPEEAT